VLLTLHSITYCSGLQDHDVAVSNLGDDLAIARARGGDERGLATDAMEVTSGDEDAELQGDMGDQDDTPACDTSRAYTGEWYRAMAGFKLYDSEEPHVPTVRSVAYAMLREKREGNISDASFNRLCKVFHKALPQPNRFPKCAFSVACAW
jgi:hypothetical protein